MPKGCTNSIRYTFSVIVLCMCVPVVTVAQDSDHPASDLPVPYSHLTDDDILYVTQLMDELTAPTFEWPKSPYPSVQPSLEQQLAEVLISSIDSVDDNDPDTRLAVVTTYDYKSNETTRILIDLLQREVIAERRVRGGGAPLSEIEKHVATSLVLADQSVVALLDTISDEVEEVEFLLTRTEDPEDIFYDKRVVTTLLRATDGYLSTPPIFVNLTDFEVVIEGRSE